MFFSVPYLATTGFIQKYDWNGSKPYPKTPEYVIRNILGRDLVMLPWSAERGDRGQITVDNVLERDWITHCGPDSQ